MRKYLHNSSKVWALVTGGSSGIGYEFSKQLAEQGYNIIIASRDGEKLLTATKELRSKFKVEVEAISVDLSIDADIEKLTNIIKNQKRPVEVLVNDAGFALHDSLLNEDCSRQIAAFSVMAEAVLKLSGAAAVAMKNRGFGHIINISSTSAWLFAGNYSALKRWTVVYTESLALELKGSGVTATAVCPGWVKTDFHENGGVSRPNVPNWIWIPVDVVVRSALSAAARGKSRVVPTLRWKTMIFFLKHCEGVARAISRRLVIRRVAELKRKRHQ